ncbi:MAG: thiamine phosphate synthase [bacterium]|nr:thiamine phosphate synthase [bacterium]
MKDKKFCPICGQPLTIKFIEGRDRLFCASCDGPVYENPITATAAVVFNQKDEVLMVKRNVEPQIGKWCLPGGYLEMDETPETGCLRELKEETGLDGEIQEMEGNFLGANELYPSIVIMGYSVTNVSGKLMPGDDCRDARFFHYKKIPRVAFSSHRKILGNALMKRLNRNRAQEMFSSGRRELNPLMGAYVITSGDHADIARKACIAGARILQYRDKNADRKEVLKKAIAIREITNQYKTLLIINDYVDIALLAGADGVHLGQDDIPISTARMITPPGFIIGISTHSLQQAVKAEQEGADYIGSGPVFDTPTKAHYTPIGVDTLEKVLKTVRLPVVAIGGLNPENIPPLREMGARNFAMVRAFRENTGNVVKQINRIAL